MSKFKYSVFLLLLLFCLKGNAQGKGTEKAKFGVIIYPNVTKASLVSYVSAASAFNNYKHSHFAAGIGVKCSVYLL